MQDLLAEYIIDCFDRSPQTLADRFDGVLSPFDWLPWANRTGQLMPAFGLASLCVFTTIYLVYGFLTSMTLTVVAIILRFTRYRDVSVMLGVCSWLPTIMLVFLRIWAIWKLDSLKDKVEEMMEDWRRTREASLMEEFRREVEIGGGRLADAVLNVE